MKNTKFKVEDVLSDFVSIDSIPTKQLTKMKNFSRFNRTKRIY